MVEGKKRWGPARPLAMAGVIHTAGLQVGVWPTSVWYSRIPVMSLQGIHDVQIACRRIS